MDLASIVRFEDPDDDELQPRWVTLARRDGEREVAVVYGPQREQFLELAEEGGRALAGAADPSPIDPIGAPTATVEPSGAPIDSTPASSAS